MRLHCDPIGRWRPTWNWFKLGVMAATSPMPWAVLGLGFISFEVHSMIYEGEIIGGWFDIDIFINSPLGHVGVELRWEDTLA